MKEGLNVVHVAGYVRDKPAMVPTKTGKILKFKLAIPYSRKDDEKWKTDYTLVEVAMWGVQGRNLHKVLQTGGHIYVGGKLRYSTYKSEKLKSTVTTTYIQADKVLLLGRRSRRS